MLRRTSPRLRDSFIATAGWNAVEAASRFSEGWELAFRNRSGVAVSPWHDVPFRAAPSPGGHHSFYYVNEIPRCQREKLEIATKVPHNPIRQDRVKKTGALRSFTYGDIPFNYGCIPRTWEDPSIVDADTGCVGDGDPVDVVELSPSSLPVGAICRVRLLGAIALIDEGETDWKLLAVSVDTADPSSWKTMDDVPSDVVSTILRWFRFYKTTDGKPENQFAFGGAVLREDKALEVAHACSRQYDSLLQDPLRNNGGLWIPPQSKKAVLD